MFRKGINIRQHERNVLVKLIRFSSQENKNVTLKQIFNDKRVGHHHIVSGWVKSARKQKLNTFLDLNDGTTSEKLQVVAPSNIIPNDLSFHSAAVVEGELKKSSHPAQEFELIATSVKCQQTCQVEKYPIQPRKHFTQDFLRKFPSFKAKTNSVASLLRIRNCMSQAVHGYFQSNDFIQIQTPLLTANDCEGAGEVFVVRPASDETCNVMKKLPEMDNTEAYFDRKVFLTVSGQLHLEAVCNGIARVYNFSPAFRAETGRTRRHLTEFSMIEAEIAFVDDIDSILDIIEGLVKQTAGALLDQCSEDLKLYAKATKSSESISHIENFIKDPFTTLSFSEVEKILSKSQLDMAPVLKGDLSRDHELYLCSHTGGPVFVIDWPQQGKPFYMRGSGSGLVSGVDLLVPGVGELCGGGLREHCPLALQQNMARCGVDEEALQWYLDMRRHGAAKTGGFGLGFERLVQYLLGIDNIKNTIPFHRAPHSCIL